MPLTRKLSVAGCLIAAFAIAGCPAPTVVPGDDAGSSDSGVRPDTGPTPDGGLRDTGTAPDASTTDASVDECGDGVVNGTDACDDGNTDAGDGCDASCAEESGWTCDAADPTVCTEDCGDGSLVGEEAGANGCDDGNTADGDGCDATCVVESGFSCAGAPSVCMTGCGDGVVAGTEGCDDGNASDGDGCSSACASEAGYTCTGAPSTCSTACGDGTIAVGAESCDDGNTGDGDGCSATCAIETGWDCSSGVCVAVCGDGATVGAEACDDANTVTEACAYGLTSCTVCAADCTMQSGSTSFCGDTAVDAIEETCDDGNAIDETACAYGVAACTACDATCDTVLVLAGNVCGDGVVAPGDETCDDGNAIAADGCSASCAVEPGYVCTGAPSTCSPVCGDGLTVAPETCDDSNTVTEPCAYGLTSCTVCNATCQTAPGTVTFCGDGALNGGAGAEVCDDGDTSGVDCCSATCGDLCTETELNGTTATANPIVSGTPVTGGIEGIGDVDFWTFTLATASNVRIETFDASGTACTGTASSDTLIDLFRADGTTLVVGDDDDGIGFCSLIDPNVDAAARMLPAGTYFIRVHEFGDNQIIDRYTLVLTAGALQLVAPTGNSTQRGSTVGGTAFNDACPAGSALVGVSAAPLPPWLSRIGGICAPISAIAPGAMTVGADTALPIRGLGAEALTTLHCPANEVVVGFDGAAGGLVDRVRLICAPLTLSVTGAITFGAESMTGSVGGSGGTTFPATRCPTGMIANVARIRAGDDVDAFGLGCATPAYR